MQLTPKTLDLLKNFSEINTGIFIKTGSHLQTTEQASRSMAAYATVTEEFPQDFGIYDLSQLLSIIGLSKVNPEIDFAKNHMTIQHLSGRSQFKYRFCSEDMLTVPGDEIPKLSNQDIKFKLDEADYQWVLTTKKVLQSPNIAVVSNGKKVFLKTFDAKNDSQPEQSLEIAAEANGDKYVMTFDAEFFNKLISGSYDVSISKDGISHFKSTDMDLEYFIALDEDNSNYGS